MAVLTAKQRKSMPASVFAGPAGTRSYPIPDKSHARVALGRATQQERKGNLSHSAAAHIKARANTVLGSN